MQSEAFVFVFAFQSRHIYIILLLNYFFLVRGYILRQTIEDKSWNNVRLRLYINLYQTDCTVASLTVKADIAVSFHIWCGQILWKDCRQLLIITHFHQLIIKPPCRDWLNLILIYLVHRESFFMKLKDQIHQLVLFVSGVSTDK